jgi:glycosyltransferase involved in cell wall biosynthesis
MKPIAAATRKSENRRVAGWAILMTRREVFFRWLRRLRSYALAFVPPVRQYGDAQEVLRIDAPTAVRMFQQQRHALYGRTIEISTPTVHRIDYRDSAETSLRIARARSVTWVDAQGGRVKWNPVWISGPRFVLDKFLAPMALRQHVSQLDALIQGGVIPVQANADLDRCLYLRLDTISGLVAGGAVAHTVGIVDAFRKRLKKLTFACFERLPALSTDVDVAVVPTDSKSEFGSNNPVVGFEAIVYHGRMLDHLKDLCRQSRPAFLYQRYCQGQYAGAWFARQHRIPFVLEFNGSEIWIARHWGDGVGRKMIPGEDVLQKMEDANLAAASLIIVVSEVLRDQLTARGYDPARILVLPNGVNADAIGPHLASAANREHLGLPLDVPIVGFIGSLGLWHGVEVLIDAFDRLLRDYPDVAARSPRLLIIGDGDRMPMVRAEIEKRNLGAFVKLAGLVPQAEGAQFLAVSDILVSPHVPNPDGSPFFGSPTKIFEYMALQRPIVASRLGQIGAVLEHERTALLTEPGNTDELARALATLIRQPELGQRLALAARREAVERHSWDSRVETILAALEARKSA